MKVDQVLRMVGGAGDSSYAKNSDTQKEAIEKVRRVVEESVLGLCSTVFMESIGIADLGCSSGPNALLAISEIIQTIHWQSHQFGNNSPEFQVFLNDLPGNDFNTIFKSLPSFMKELKKKTGSSLGPCFFAGVPGSFYGRLFPSRSLHFVHSSYSLHWLSQVPEDLETGNGTLINKRSIYVGKTSPPGVFQSYLNQFRKDFSLFLRSRSKEMVPGGRMVLTLQGRRNGEPCSGWGTLSDVLNDMVSEGYIEEAKVDSFNLPFYAPSVDELKDVINMQGSFHLNRVEINGVKWRAKEEDIEQHGLRIAMSMRAVTETMIAGHFGEAILDVFFRRLGPKIAEASLKQDDGCVNLTLSLTRIK